MNEFDVIIRLYQFELTSDISSSNSEILLNGPQLSSGCQVLCEIRSPVQRAMAMGCLADKEDNKNISDI